MGYLIQLSRPGVDVLKRLLSFLLLHKRLVLLVVGITGFGVPLVILASYQVIETVDSTGFCTQVCHKVHYPEAVTLVASPHKEVTCSACHVGPGTRNLVESKLRGLRDIIPTVTNTYPHPIPTPLKERRPSSQTCEKCHWAEKFSGDMPVVETSYSLDQQNTRNTIALVLKVNGGREEVASGIHWHSTAKVWYLPVDSERLKIAWAGVEDASGNITEYTDPNLMSGITSERLDKEKRLMDCMDCHNRATHLFRPPDQLIDMALTDGSIDTKLPFIKAEALKALVPQNESLDQAYTRIAEIKEFYRTSYPQVFQEKEASIDNAITKLREIAVLTTFSGNLDWNTHKDNSGHDKPDSEMQIDWDTLSSLDQSSGCFRCHGNLEKAESKGGNGTDRVKFLSPGSGTAGTGGINPGATRTSGSGTGLNGSNGTISSKGGSPEGKLDAECNLCHYTLTSPFISPLAPATSHPIDGLDKCLTCHSPEAPKPFKTDHPWSTNEACNTCHQAAPKLKSLSSVTLSAPSEKPITHSTNKMDDCLVCHSPTASSPIKDDHPWSTNETCNACHEPAKKLKPIPSPTPVTDKPITHSTEKMDDCLVCHAPSASSPVKNDHPWSANENCVSCHQLAPKLKPLPLAVPPKASEVTHSTSGLTDCLVCHAPSSPMPFKADHPWSTNETCSSCHKQAAVIKSFAPSTGGFGSPVTHSVSGLGSCSACHNQGGTARFPASHAGRPDSFCLLCHQSAAGQVPNQPPPPPPAMVVPPVAHPVDAARQDCLLCHGPSGTSPFGSSHAGRTIYTCLLCHQLSSTQQTAPSAPTGLTATASSVTLVNLTWVDNAGDETGFRIQRATDNAFTANVVAMTAGANAMSYSDAGVSGSTTYYYRVLAYNSAGDSAASNTASVTTPIPTGTAPAAPTGLAATASSATQVNLTWVDNAGNETGYRIDRAADSTFTTNLVTMTAGANITSYSDSTVVGSTIYYYRVFAYNAAGNSTASNTANVTTPAPPIDPAALYTTSCASCHGASRQGSASGPAVTAGALAGRTLTQITTSLTTGSMSGYTSGMTSAERAALAEWLKGYPPAAPTTLAATAVSAGQVNLTWVDNAGDETGYRIERATNNTFTANSITHTVGANTTSYSDTTVSGSTTYYYRVYAYNVSGDSATSNTASVTTPVATGSPPSVPTAVAAEALSATQVILSWEDNSNNETGFRIERATNDTFSANLVTTNVAANVTSYTDTTVSGETRYYYRMFAYNAAGSSSESNKCSVTTPTPPIDPAALYSSNCASCHGANREGGSASALTPAALAGRSLSQVTNTIAGGVGSMPGYSSLMTSNEMSALAEWLKGYPPAAPTTLSATAVSAGQVNLTWVDNASDETGYRIERATNNTFTANLITNTAGANATSYNDATVSGSTTYYYRVYAYNVSGDSAASNTASVTTPAATVNPPSAPTNLTATAASATQVNLTWTDNASNETGFRIQRATNSTFTTNLVTLTTGAGATSYSDTTVSKSTTYYYRVRAYNSGGDSAASNTRNVTTPTPPIDPAALYAEACASCHGANREGGAGGPAVTASALSSRTLTQVTNSLTTGSMSSYTSSMTSAETSALAQWLKGYPPAAPTTLSATAVSAGQVNLTWVDNASDETGYRIERATNNTFTANVITNTAGANATSYNDATVSGSTTYYYRVYAYNVSGDSAASNTASVTTPAATVNPPSAPTNLTATAASATQVNLTWTDNASNETGFRIQRATNSTFTTNLVAMTTGSNTTSYNDSTVSGSTTYYYRIYAYNSGGDSAASNTGSVTTPAAPVDPAALYASYCASCHGASRQGSASGPAVTASALSSRTLTQVTNSLTTGSMSSYTSSMTSAEIAALAAWLKGTTPTAPAAPGSLAAIAPNPTQVNLTWVDNSNNESGFRVQRATNNTFTVNVVTLTAGADATSYSDTTVSATTTYYYRVYAYNGIGDSAVSNTASVTTPSPTGTIPSAPTGLAATASSATQVNLTWTDNAGNETGYRIDRATNNTFTTNLVTLTTGSNTTSYSDTTVVGSTTYYYRVFASNSAGNSAASNTASATTPAVVTAPQIAHTLNGYTDCNACHLPSLNIWPYPSDHAGRTNSTCTTCHQSSGSTSAPTLTVSGAGRLDHSYDSAHQNCLSCHDRGRPEQFRVSHIGRTNITCLVCHRTR